jgi:hypothetical protein
MAKLTTLDAVRMNRAGLVETIADERHRLAESLANAPGLRWATEPDQIGRTEPGQIGRTEPGQIGRTEPGQKPP